MDVTQRNILFGVVGGLAVGGGAGYLVAQKTLSKKYETLFREEIASVKDAYEKLSAGKVYPTVRDAVEQLIPDAERRLAEEYHEKAKQYATEAIVEAAVEERVEPDLMENRNVFQEATKLSSERNPDAPYLITTQEYADGLSGHESVTLTYYKKDDVLVDERDMPIDAVEETVGIWNLTQFGVDEQETNVLYVRNERVSLDFEIILDEGSYTAHVFGGAG